MKLDSAVGDLPFVGPTFEKRLRKLEIKTIEDLLLHVPHRYLDFSSLVDISQTEIGEVVTIKGQVIEIKNQYTRSRKVIQLAEISDGTGTIPVVWFNQTFLSRTLPPGSFVSLSGKVNWWNRKKALISPEYEKILPGKEVIHTGKLVPLYPETRGISSKWLRARINTAFKELKRQEQISEFLPSSKLKKLGLIDLISALESVHFPKTIQEAERGRKRLAFNELLFLQLTNTFRKLNWQKNEVAHQLSFDQKEVNQFISSLPFKLTSAQEKATKEILQDLKEKVPMNRLLEGDVGSGKTVVAAIASFASFLNGHQTVIMAPTQILAEQHYQTFKELFAPFKVRVSLITGSSTKKDLGRNDLFIGTHALIYRKMDFDRVGLVVIDEQHRFGVEQRSKLIKKSGKRTLAPHVLTMTATPIPRTIALNCYGDLDLSVLDELPSGRLPITTWIVPPTKREKSLQWVKKEIAKKKVQAFLVCPLIEESNKEMMQQVKAAIKEYQELKKTFPDLKFDLLHGRLKAKEKNEIINKFKKGKTDILVTTPVVEVGIDIPKATIMIIEASERFGLAQLHQLRGRVGRGKKQSYCMLMTEVKSQKALTRLKALQRTLSGFELAELDLQLRGPGEVYGTKQHGFPELKIANWQEIKLIKQAKQMAQEAIQKPEQYQTLLQKFSQKEVAFN